ncbi:DNA repair protein RecN [Amylibacter sp.]|jgi:DNA repair protein RecN (Recombination protein N)|nr:DNA repair protein RecN [Amylibacter sp.]MDB4116860.1 DNA repair protein RecN [Amylibacter sp.]MDB4190276.1 DNA repair protein RecN [Amylibacter sp.]MDB9807104.1 DNA repair protein RecN [Amylibacter sp.]MDB9878560.1 DNA repair protein RecN [Amylibacter sp.]|tara:strand:+ start:3481 stop:5118 length:1638 start_codon:yes stop_codon:yes gene_type:complete
MLRGLFITNMLLIERLELNFQPGLNVLTGETGAGKSILLDSLGFVLGWRGRASLVRDGADSGEVIAYFDIKNYSSVRKILLSAGIPDTEELILRRTVNLDGRKTAYVNDKRCSGEILKQLSDVLVELHGQHDDRGLLNPRSHINLLDNFGDINISKLRSLWKSYKQTEIKLHNAKLAFSKSEQDNEYINHSINEIQELAPEQNEDELLDIKRRSMQTSQKIRGDIEKASELLSLNGAEGSLTDAIRWIEEISEHADGYLDNVAFNLSSAISKLSIAQQDIDKYLSSTNFNPLELEKIEERLFAIRALARKHSVLPNELNAILKELIRNQENLKLNKEEITYLEKKLSQEKGDYDKYAHYLSKMRKQAAKELEFAMGNEMAPLKLQHSKFIVNINLRNANEDGVDEVAFIVSTNPGAPAGPINKIASGGELSRFLLALKVCLAKSNQNLTMIFDEIDRGVGGATANAVGQRLSEIAKSSQVLVVTHSPQVAAKGDHHWQVLKTVIDNVTVSNVIELNPNARINEIARMLSGDKITPEAKAAAKALL